MKDFRLSATNIPLPPGTDVVLKVDLESAEGTLLKAGTVGRVEVGHHHVYDLVTASGARVTAGRDQLAIKKHAVAERLLADQGSFEDLASHAIFRAVVGSVAWGLADETSDLDTRGVFLMPFDRASSLFRQPEQITDPATDTEYWEVEKALQLLLRSDPNAIELVWSPEVLFTTPLAERIRLRRRELLSQSVVGSFGRYALSQMVKIENRLEDERKGALLATLVRGGSTEKEPLAREIGLALWPGDPEKPRRQRALQTIQALVHSAYDRALIPSREFEPLVDFLRASPGATLFAERPYRPKNAYNLLRLLHSGLSLVRTGEPMIRVEGPLRDRLLAVKKGEVDIAEVIREARALGRELEESAADFRVLPLEPPYRLADEILRAARREAARASFATGRASRARNRPPLAALANRDSFPFTLPDEAWEFVESEIDRGLVQLGLVGSHAYGFPSPDSDLDLKGIHLAPASAVLGLGPVPDTRDRTTLMGGIELDFTSHEAGKALGLLVRGNGNMIERILSPFQLVTGRIPETLKALALRSIGPQFSRHYLGFLRTLEKELDRQTLPQAKTVLYVYRVALTGLHLLRERALVLDVRPLAEKYGYPEVADFIRAKKEERSTLDMSIDPSRAREVVAALDALAAALPAPDPEPLSRLANRILVALRRSVERGVG